jgi:hypothetical protein
MRIIGLHRLRRPGENESPERWRLHLLGPLFALYAAFAVAVTVLSMIK